MNRMAKKIEIALRIPGAWGHPRELLERLPKGMRLTPDSLTLEDGTQVEFAGLPPDGQFAGIFRSSCRGDANPEELATIDRYKVNVTLRGPGGSKQSAHAMMKAACVFIQAGGAGVFIDNSAMAHGGQDWLKMTEDGSPEALSFAFVTIVRGDVDINTMGFHCLGLPDIVMRREDVEKHDFDIVEVIRYLAEGEKPVGEGHIIADLGGPRFRVATEPADQRLSGSVMENPFGLLRLVSFRDIAESN